MLDKKSQKYSAHPSLPGQLNLYIKKINKKMINITNNLMDAYNKATQED